MTERNAVAVAAFIHGSLVGTVMRPDFPVLVDRVDQHADTDGRYLPYFDIITKSGVRVRVSLEVIDG
jgi:hypothetical protein